MISPFVLALGLAAVIGLSLGLLGSGGSIITLPVLVYVAGLAPADAVAMSLAIVGAVSLVGAGMKWWRGDFHPKAVAFLGGTGMVGAYFGSTLTRRVPGDVLMLLFAALMVGVGIVMLRRRELLCTVDRCRPGRCLAIGAGVGVLTGFLGVGGGFLIVPALVLLAGVDTKKAVGASLAIIALNSCSGLFWQLQSASLDWELTVWFLALALLGMWFGAAAGDRLSQGSLRQAFAWSIVGVGVMIGGISVVDLSVS